MTFWGLSTRNVLRHRTRNALTALGIALSVLALYSILSFNGGFMRNLDEELNAAGIHMAFVEMRSRLQDLVQRYGLFETLDRDHFYPGVEEALRVIQEETQP